MINAFTNALRSVYANIPEPILTAAFRPRDYQVTLDQRIKDAIINGRVLPDCNINAGKIKRIPLTQCRLENTLADPGLDTVINPSQGSLYRVPPEAREFRDIVGVIDISYQCDYTGINDSPFGFGNNGNTVKSLAAAALNSHTHRNANLTPTPMLMADNMILINPSNSFFNDWALVCRLGYDDEFTNLSNSSVQPLSKLILTATKAYVWTNLSIRIDQAELSGGQELGQFKQIVDSYLPELEKYDEELTKFRASTLFDPEATRYFLRSLL